MAIAGRVLSIPQDNAYVRAACPPELMASVELSGHEARGWELHPAFTPGWLRRHRAEFDVVHLHFGFERVSIKQLSGWLAELSGQGIPLVFTVHDLVNPHLLAQSHHQAQLRLLIGAADRVITLTPGAAGAIAEQFGRAVEIIAHPGLLHPATHRDPPPYRLVGLYLKQRAQVVDPEAVVLAALRGANRCGALLRVDAHPEMLASLRQTSILAAAGRLDLRVTAYLDDEAFGDYLGSLNVSVLPYRFGTHSGWLEACRDVGTTVVAPDCGYYRQQWEQVIGYPNNEHSGLDAEALSEAVSAALSRPRPAPADQLWRSEQQRAVREHHRSIYTEVLDGRIAA